MTAASTPASFIRAMASSGVKAVTWRCDRLLGRPVPQRWICASTICIASPRSRRLGRPASFEYLTDPGYDPLAVREHVAFEDGAIGYRHLQGADPLHRGLEPREGRRVLGGNSG